MTDPSSWLLGQQEDQSNDHIQLLYREYQNLYPHDIIYIFTENKLFYVAHSGDNGVTILPLMTYVLNPEQELVPMPMPLSREACRSYFMHVKNMSEAYKIGGYEGGLA